MDDIFQTLISRTDKDGFTRAEGEDVDFWATELKISVSTFLDQIGQVLARKYHTGDASFEFCDSLVNDLSGVFIDRVGKPNEIKWPDLFFEVYEAFDAGEYHRSPDKSDNPIADFTSPLIAKIVAKVS